ncbi:hypothetical protein Agub_g10017 [Astrephomene gubernaculifera]|uniref:Uncharacterized protein n=1 Tax=Astrephomene gubernaculifera TaxID=47775 RepID=A0AAD3HPS6_9CHLO|nr:hypothetical protein Agub_g10017 [Astrephomene gubernaculifera]
MATLTRSSPAVRTTTQLSAVPVPTLRCPRASVTRHKYYEAQRLRQTTLLRAKRATEEDERLIEEMKRAAEKGDLLEGGFAEVLVKILAVVAILGLFAWLGYLAQPVIDNTVASFPSAAP